MEDKKFVEKIILALIGVTFTIIANKIWDTQIQGSILIILLLLLLVLFYFGLSKKKE